MLTTKEAAERLGCAVITVHKAIKRGQMAAVKHGRDWFISAEEVERYKAAPKNKGGRPRKEVQ